MEKDKLSLELADLMKTQVTLVNEDDPENSYFYVEKDVKDNQVLKVWYFDSEEYPYLQMRLHPKDNEDIGLQTIEENLCGLAIKYAFRFKNLKSEVNEIDVGYSEVNSKGGMSIFKNSKYKKDYDTFKKEVIRVLKFR